MVRPATRDLERDMISTTYELISLLNLSISDASKVVS